MSEKYSPRIGVIADDLTGAGDISAQFADRGLKVVLDTGVKDSSTDIPDDAEVWVINTQSRNISEHKAEKNVAKALDKLKEWNAEYYYKKIDSTLRGNLGAELDVFIEKLDLEYLPFCAAFPDMGRTTDNGIHMVNGKRLEETAYKNDPLSPVETSDINKLLTAQMQNFNKVQIKDCNTNEDLETLSEETESTSFAGASALAGKLADKWLPINRRAQTFAVSPGSVLIINGSLNPVSIEQVDYLRSTGLSSIEVDQMVKKDYLSHDLVLSTPTEKIPLIMKKLKKSILDLWFTDNWDRAVLNGGETAWKFMETTGISRLNVIRSVLPGIVLTEYEKKYFILKPGGYGQSDTLMKLIKILGGR